MGILKRKFKFTPVSRLGSLQWDAISELIQKEKAAYNTVYSK